MYIHNILNDTGLSNMWSQYVSNTKWLHITVKQMFRDQFLQRWNQDIFYSSKGKIYRLFKTEHKLEQYYFRMQEIQRVAFVAKR